jgi:hypothetical protein
VFLATGKLKVKVSLWITNMIVPVFNEALHHMTYGEVDVTFHVFVISLLDDSEDQHHAVAALPMQKELPVPTV